MNSTQHNPLDAIPSAPRSAPHSNSEWFDCELGDPPVSSATRSILQPAPKVSLRLDSIPFFHMAPGTVAEDTSETWTTSEEDAAEWQSRSKRRRVVRGIGHGALGALLLAACWLTTQATDVRSASAEASSAVALALPAAELLAQEAEVVDMEVDLDDLPAAVRVAEVPAPALVQPEAVSPRAELAAPRREVTSPQRAVVAAPKAAPRAAEAPKAPAAAPPPAAAPATAEPESDADFYAD